MSRDKKEAQREFNEVLEKSCSDKIKEEKVLSEKVRLKNLDFQDILKDIKEANFLLEIGKKDITKLTAEIVEKNKEYEAIKAKITLEKEGLEKSKLELVTKEMELEQKAKENLEKIRKEEKSFTNQCFELEERIKTNDFLLDVIKKEKKEIEEKNKKLEIEQINFAEMQRKKSEGLKEREDKIKTDLAKLASLEGKEQSLLIKDKNLDNKDNVLKLKETNFINREMILTDKELDMEVRSVELDRQEKRIKNLMELNKK